MIKNLISKLKRHHILCQTNKITLPDFKPSHLSMRKNYIFSGKVKYVGFRMEVFCIAKRLGLTGFTLNHRNGDVEVEIQGDPLKIDYLINHIYSVKRFKITNTKINDITIVNEEKDFIIK